MNMNGGDSWAYYFPQTNPEILMNFKGEQNYALKEIAPEVYKKYKKLSATIRAEIKETKLKTQKTGTAYLAFLDKDSDTYFRGTYCYDTNELDLHRTGSLVKVQHFLKQHGQEDADFIPEWRYEFDFTKNTIFNPEKRFLNRFQPSAYMKASKASKDDTGFPVIKKIIDNVTGHNPETYERFMNWLSYIIQYRRPANTAWLMHGIQGTGKGVLFNHILSPLVGSKYVQVKRLDEIEEDYNGYMQDCIFLLIDEVQISDAKHKSRAMAKIKNMIVEPTISLRAMYSGHVMVRNWVSIIFASNMPDAILIDPSDRRLNVCPLTSYMDMKSENKTLEILWSQQPKITLSI